MQRDAHLVLALWEKTFALKAMKSSVSYYFINEPNKGPTKSHNPKRQLEAIRSKKLTE
jgi:hypothetical protein